MPMVRTILPPIEFCWWPNTCSTRARTLERVVFADFWRSDNGRFRAACRWIWLFKPLRLQARLNLHRAVGAVRPDPIAGIGEIEHIVQLLTVVHGRVRRIPFADQLVRLVHAEVVLVAEEARIVLLRPARVLVLLGILGGLLLPTARRLAGPDRLVLLLRVALPGHRHNRGVNNLAAARNIALSLNMLAEALKQLVDQPGLRQRLAKQPDRGGIRHRVLELQIEKAHERYAVADQVLSPIVREIVERP